VIENISIVNNYRSQFNRVIAKSSFGICCRNSERKQFGRSRRQAENMTVKERTSAKRKSRIQGRDHRFRPRAPSLVLSY
jgi:hypothetical protein